LGLSSALPVSHPHLAVLAATLPMRALGSSQALSHPRGFQGKPTGVEPNPIYHDELQRLRSCKLLPTCASNSTEEVELTLPTDTWIGALGGINGGRMREYEKQISHKERASVAKNARCSTASTFAGVGSVSNPHASPRAHVASPLASPVSAVWSSRTSYARRTALKCSAAGGT
jgi:hypothetical protein